MTILGLIGALLILLFGLFFLFIALTSLLSVVSGAQFVETPATVFDDIINISDLGPTDRFLELGSGMGSLCYFVAKQTSAKVIGVDINPLLTMIARWRSRDLPSATFKVGNILRADLARADVIYCYLLPPLLQALEKRFDRELSTGARIISYGFPLPGRKPIQTVPRTVGRGALYVYEY